MITYNSLEIYGFTGFYNSLWNNADSDWCWAQESDNAIYLIKRELEVTTSQAYQVYKHIKPKLWDFFEQDFDSYIAEVVKYYAKVYFEQLSDLLGCDIKVISQTVTSPKEYNYTSDRIFAHVECEDSFVETLLNVTQENWDFVADIIRNDWKDKDGFVSFLSNDLNVWVNAVRLGSGTEAAIYTSVLSRYLLSCEHCSLENLLYDKVACECGVTQDNYYYIPDEKKEELRIILKQLQ